MIDNIHFEQNAIRSRNCDFSYGRLVILVSVSRARAGLTGCEIAETAIRMKALGIVCVQFVVNDVGGSGGC